MRISRILRRVWTLAVISPFLCCAVLADDCPSGSDGSDGPLNCTTLGCPPGCDEFNPCTVEVDLSLAADASWDTPSPMPGNGVYDADEWAVVFKYTTIDIPAGVTVTFNNHPKNPPVMWFATGDVTIEGTVNVNGENGFGPPAPMNYPEPGPGGFAGGVRGNSNPLLQWSAGFGPGGGGYSPDRDGEYGCGSKSYGNLGILPLIGGSGAAGSISGGFYRGAGAGGGAILIATPTHVVLDGAITANGGTANQGGRGSGGAIRLVANSVSGAGMLRAVGGAGAGGNCGRIRIDAPVINLSDVGDPNWTTDFACWPVFPPSDAPMLRATVVDGEALPADPLAGIETADAQIHNADAVMLLIEATGIPAGTSVQVRVVPARGDDFTVTSTNLGAPDPETGVSTATASLTFPPGKSEIQLKANWTP